MRYFNLFTVAISLWLCLPNFTATAQSISGDVVMTKSQLEDFLSRIAQYKKQQLKQQSLVEQINRNMDSTLVRLVLQKQLPTYSESKLADELLKLNQKVDLLLQNPLNGTSPIGIPAVASTTNPPNPVSAYNATASTAKPTTSSKSGKVIAKKPSTASTNLAGMALDVVQTALIDQKISELTKTQTQEFEKLQKQITALEKSIANSKTAGQSELANENLALRQKIELLNQQLNEKSKKTDSLLTLLSKSDLVNENLSQHIYFTNNSTKISKKDKKTIERLAKNFKANQIIVLKGFASKVGTAYYNQLISFNRANAVKKEFVQNGLKASDILILTHGVDSKSDEKSARRVEIIIKSSVAN